MSQDYYRTDRIPGGVVEIPADMFSSMMEASARIEAELKVLRGERRDLLKKLGEWEREGHSTVGIAFLRRHFESSTKRKAL